MDSLRPIQVPVSSWPAMPPQPRLIPSSIFDKPTEDGDVTLTVEGRQLHVNKTILSNASIVFRRMFQGNFQENTAKNVPLPGKSYEDIVEMLMCIYPSKMKEIKREKVDVLLKLADEYQMEGLTQRCEAFLLTLCEYIILKNTIDNTEIVHFMYLADKYGMSRLAERATDIACVKIYKGAYFESSLGNRPQRTAPLIEVPEFRLISDKTLALYFGKRVYYMEKIFKDNNQFSFNLQNV